MRFSKVNRAIIACISDTHAHFRLGLFNPETRVQDDNAEYYTPAMNEPQRYLWDDVHVPAIKSIADLAGKDPIIGFHLGDVVHGNKHATELMTTRLSDQIDAAAGNSISPGILHPFLSLKNVVSFRLAKGTAAHNFGEGSADIQIIERLKMKYPKIDFRTVYHGLADIADVNVDYFHHGAHPGTRNWLKGNVARFYLRDLILQHIEFGADVPQLFISGHYHTLVEIIDKFMGYKTRLVVMPGMCFPTDWTVKITKSLPFVKHGWVAFEVINGRIIESFEFTQAMDIRTKEKLL